MWYLPKIIVILAIKITVTSLLIHEESTQRSNQLYKHLGKNVDLFTE
jgi:hypothetical protein